MSRGKKHYLLSADLPKSFSQLIMPIFVFPNPFTSIDPFSVFFAIDYDRWENVEFPRIAYIVIL